MSRKAASDLVLFCLSLVLFAASAQAVTLKEEMACIQAEPPVDGQQWPLPYANDKTNVNIISTGDDKHTQFVIIPKVQYVDCKSKKSDNQCWQFETYFFDSNKTYYHKFIEPWSVNDMADPSPIGGLNFPVKMADKCYTMHFDEGVLIRDKLTLTALTNCPASARAIESPVSDRGVQQKVRDAINMEFVSIKQRLECSQNRKHDYCYSDTYEARSSDEIIKMLKDGKILAACSSSIDPVLKKSLLAELASPRQSRAHAPSAK